MSLYFLEISGSSTRLLSVDFQAIKNALQGLSGKDDCQIYHCYRTVGENKLVLILNGDADIVVDAIDAALNGNISVACTPLRSYQNFIRNLGGDEKLCVEVSPAFTSPIKNVFFNRVTLEHPGKSTEEFNRIWKEHAEHSFEMRAKGVGDFHVYKVVGRREAIIFLNTESVDKFDDATPTYRLVQGLGDGFNADLKALKPVM